MLPYILNFDQAKLKDLNLKGIEEFKSGSIRKVLDADDLLILRFIYKISNLETRRTLEIDKGFFWVKYEALFKEYEGLLFISKASLNNRLNKYKEMQLIERYTLKNQDGTFSFFKITGLKGLIYIPKEEKPVDSTGKTPMVGQVHVDEVIEAQNEVDEEIINRISDIERVLKTRADKKIISLVHAFKNDYEYHRYFDMNLYPMIENNEKHNCKYISNSLKRFLQI